MPSARFIAAIAAQETSERPVTLVTIDHASFDAPIRLASGGVDVTCDGLLYTARAMKVSLPGEGPEPSARRGRLQIDNVDPAIVAQLRAASSKPSVELRLVLGAWPDDVELEWLGLRIETQRPLVDTIDVELAPRDDSTETWPVQAYTPFRCPGLF